MSQMFDLRPPPMNHSPDEWIAQIFSARAAQGGVVRRSPRGLSLYLETPGHYIVTAPTSL